MKTKILILLFTVSTIVFAQYTAKLSVNYSPKGGCTEKIISCIDSAKNTIYVQAYSFTSIPISSALIRAMKREVHVRVILDKASNRTIANSRGRTIDSAGIETYVDSRHAIAHNKIMIIDSSIVLTGSFNFTSSAELRNAENLLTIRGRAISLRYLENWTLHKKHSEPW